MKQEIFKTIFGKRNQKQKNSSCFIVCASSTRAEREQGIALLFTVLLTSMLLVVAIGISNIVFKELIFSAEARDSDKAFFAADTGIECALYLDKSGPDYASGIFIDPSTAVVTGGRSCSGRTYEAGTSSMTGPTGTTENFQFIIPVGTQCAQVIVDKDYVLAGVSYTRFQSIGYNVSAPTTGTSCIVGTPNVRVVSRAIEVKYQNP